MPLMPRQTEWTVDDLDELPDDGLQYELADGVLLVTPSPRPKHQRMLGRLYVRLVAACPDDLEVFLAPFDFRPSRVTSLQPDLMVVRRSDVDDIALRGTPLLVVEILSPSTRAKDLVLKRSLYAEAGVPSYWVLDPAEESVMVLALRDGAYVELAGGTGEVHVDAPFPMTLHGAALLV